MSVKLIEKIILLAKAEYKFDIKYPRDCEDLARAIFHKTNSKLSDSTVKRFLGFVKTKDRPSKFTLNTFANYCGYEGWDEFVKLNSPKQNSSIQKWDTLQQKSINVSKHTLEAIKQSSGISFENTVKRKFAFDFIDSFYHSNHIATGLVGDGGTGKSVSVAHCIDEYWLCDDPKYKNDIVWFISGSNLRGLFSKQFEIESWFLEMFGLTTGTDYRDHFNTNPKERKGKLILIFDALDEISIKTDELESLFRRLIEFIASSKSCNWVKVILTTRTSTWERFVDVTKDFQGVTKLITGVSFDNISSSITNIPPLTQNEIKTIIKTFTVQNIGVNIETSTITPNVWKLISHPYYLQIFLQGCINSKTQINNSYDLLSEFVQHRIYKGKYGFEKNEIFSAIIGETKNGSSALSVKRKSIEPVILKYKRAYKELISFGILKEQAILNKYRVHVPYISFSHDCLFEHFISKRLLEEYNGFSYSMLERVTELYKASGKRIDILKQLIAFGLETKQYREFVKIFNLPLEDHELNAISHLIGMRLRESKEMQGELISKWCKNKNAQIYFFERFVDLDCLSNGYFGEAIGNYLSNKKTNEAQIFGYSLLYLKDWLSENKTKTENAYRCLNKFSFDSSIHPFPLGRQMAVKILHQKRVSNSKLSASLVSEITSRGTKINHKNVDSITGFSAGYYFHIVEALFLTGEYSEVINQFEFVENNFQGLTENKNTWLFQMMRVYASVGYLVAGEKKLAKKLFGEVDFEILFSEAPWYKNYFKIQYLYAKAIFVHTEKKRKDLQLVSAEIRELTNKLGFVHFEKALFAQTMQNA